MGVTIYSLKGEVYWKGPGWTAYCYRRDNDSRAIKYAIMMLPGNGTWEQLQEIFKKYNVVLNGLGIKNTVDVLMNDKRIEICRKGRTMPSVWIERDKQP